MGNVVLLRLLIVPAVAGGIAYLLGRRARVVSHALAILTTAWLLVTTMRLFVAGPLEYEFPWLAIGGVDITIALATTTLGSLASVLASAFAFLVSLYGVSYVGRETPLGRHHAYMLWAVAGTLGALLANQLLFLLISWEIVTLMLYLLVGLSGERARKGAAKTFTILGLADCALLLGILLLVAQGGPQSLRMDGLRLGTGTAMLATAYLLMLVAALAKAGAFPFHTWLPAAAEGAECDVLAFLPASLDKLLGIYLLARLSLEFFAVGASLRFLLMAIGAITILSAVMMAMVQHNLKKLLSFHAVSQVGYMVLGIGTGTVAGIVGGLFHMINNAIYKSGLFLSAGAVERATGTTELDQHGGLARKMPVTFICAAIAALAISGVPPLNGFASKWLLYQGALAAPTKWAAVFVAAAVFGSALTLASFVKVLHSVFLGQPGRAVAGKAIGERPLSGSLPLVVLASACVLLGVFANRAVSDFVLPGLASISPVSPGLETAGALRVGDALWNPGLATGLLLLGIAVGFVLYLVGSGVRARTARSWIGGEVLKPETLHAPGTSFYNTVRELPVVQSLYGDAEREAFDIYHIGGRYGSAFVETLRAFHTGALTLYASWVLAGLVILIVCLLAAGS
ncbi:MAG: proton-conducting transporter membrane subunit [Planctomycetota bacterium]